MDIPIPAIHIDFDGAADAGFTAPATTLLLSGHCGQLGSAHDHKSQTSSSIRFSVNLKLQFLHDAFPK